MYWFHVYLDNSDERHTAVYARNAREAIRRINRTVKGKAARSILVINDATEEQTLLGKAHHMTHIEYKLFEDNVSRFLRDNNVKPGCHSGLMHGQYFSKYPCPCCKGMAGNRTEYEFARNDDNGTFRESICEQCEYYLTYDCLDDETMMEVEHSASIALAADRFYCAKLNFGCVASRFAHVTDLTWDDNRLRERKALLRQAMENTYRDLCTVLEALKIPLPL